MSTGFQFVSAVRAFARSKIRDTDPQLFSDYRDKHRRQAGPYAVRAGPQFPCGVPFDRCSETIARDVQEVGDMAEESHDAIRAVGHHAGDLGCLAGDLESAVAGLRV